MITLAFVINQKTGSDEEDEIPKVEIGSTVQQRLWIQKFGVDELTTQV